MSEPSPTNLVSPESGGRQPGEALRRAREAQGMSLESLAATIKVSSAKLEALEQGRFADLPDANFARALAMTLCRYLKLDPAPILANLPAARAIPLTAEKPPLNQPFKDFRATGPLFDRQGGIELLNLFRLRWLAPAFLLAAAALVYYLPEHAEWPTWLPARSNSAPAAAIIAAASNPSPGAVMPPAMPDDLASAAEPSLAFTTSMNKDADFVAPIESAQAASAAAAASEALLSAVAVMPASSVAGKVGLAAASVAAAASQSEAVKPQQTFSQSATQSAPNDATASLQLHSIETSWVEVRDGTGAKILSRNVRGGESVSLDGVPPLKLHIGNAPQVQLTFKGRAVDLTTHTHSNVARIELK